MRSSSSRCVHPQPPGLPRKSSSCLTLYNMLHGFLFQLLFKGVYRVELSPPPLLGLHPGIYGGYRKPSALHLVFFRSVCLNHLSYSDLKAFTFTCVACVLFNYYFTLRTQFFLILTLLAFSLHLSSFFPPCFFIANLISFFRGLILLLDTSSLGVWLGLA